MPKLPEQLHHLISLLDRLQIAADLGEAAAALQDALPKMFPNTRGFVALDDSSETWTGARATWGENPQDHEGEPPNRVLQLALALPATWTAHLHMCAHTTLPAEARNHEFVAALTNSLRLALCNLHERMWLREQAMRDSLTGLYNRRFIDDALGRELSRAQREQTVVSVLMLDLDFFKTFNDTWGHDAGDAALRHLGALLAGSVRRGDLACRLGGEEFAVVLLGAELKDACLRAEAIRAAVQASSLATADTVLPSPTVSIGVATFPQHGGTAHRLLRAADRALYAAKAKGRNCVAHAVRSEESGAFFLLKKEG